MFGYALKRTVPHLQNCALCRSANQLFKAYDAEHLCTLLENLDEARLINVLVLPMERDIVVKAQAERVNAGLLTNDSIIVAAMSEYGISRIATNDGQFDTVTGVSVYSPTDVV